MVVVGTGNTVTLSGADVPTQPKALVTVTVIGPSTPTFTPCVVAPLDHTYEAPEEATSVENAPAHTVVGEAAVIVGTKAGAALTVISLETALQPAALVTVTK